MSTKKNHGKEEREMGSKFLKLSWKWKGPAEMYGEEPHFAFVVKGTIKAALSALLHVFSLSQTRLCHWPFSGIGGRRENTGKPFNWKQKNPTKYALGNQLQTPRFFY